MDRKFSIILGETIHSIFQIKYFYSFIKLIINRDFIIVFGICSIKKNIGKPEESINTNGYYQAYNVCSWLVVGTKNKLWSKRF